MKEEIILKKYSGSMLKTIRLERGMTQQVLAHRLSELKHSHHDSTIVTRQTISKYENGERGMNLEMIADLSTVLDVPVNYFFPNPVSLENAMIRQTNNLFSKTVIDDDGFCLEIKTPIPFDELDVVTQKEIMDSSMQELLELKLKIKDSSSFNNHSS